MNLKACPFKTFRLMGCVIVAEVVRRSVRKLKSRLRSTLVRVRSVVTGDVLRSGTRRGGVITVERPDSDQLFFCYTGAARQLGLDPRTFFERTRLFERNVVLLRDEFGAFYQRGVSESIGSFEALLEWQQQYRRQLSHVRRVFCLGTSMGAYAAVQFGCLLRAEQVWALGPPLTHLDPIDGVNHSRSDLARLLASPNGVTTYHVHYSEGCAPDVEAVRRIAGCEGVRLYPHPGDRHNVVLTMVERGSLATLLPEPT